MQTEEARRQLESTLEAYLSALAQEKRYSRNTIAAYRNDLNQFLDQMLPLGAIDDGRWANVSPSLVVDYFERLKSTKFRDSTGHEKHIATSTIARKIAALKSFFRYLLKSGLIDSDPARDLDAPKVKKRLPRTLSSADVERLLTAPGQSNLPKALRDRALLELLYATGMRVSELVSLNLDDVNLVTHDVRVRNDRSDKERIIPMHERAALALQAYLERGRPGLIKNAADSSALFLNHRGQKLTRQGMWLIIKEYAEQIAIPFEVTPHTLRHSFAAHMLESHKASLGEVQHFLGHASVSTTQIYSQLTSNRDNESSET
ncbi:MAG TPA: tyrosine recombinase [Anaerolineae bacterium]|nr:tyrosine recombinase [Anaerolineae bacterium]